MDFVTSVKVVLRHWYLVLPGLVLTSAAVFGALRVVDPQYGASGTVVLLGPVVTTEAEPDRPAPPPNRLLELGGLSATTELMVQVMSDPVVEARLAGLGATADYEVQQNLQTRSPLLTVVVVGDQGPEVLRTLDVVIEGIAEELATMQEAVGVDDPNGQIQTRIIRKDGEAQPNHGSRIRAAVAVLALGGAGSLAAAFVGEAIGTARAARRSRHVKGVRPAAPRAAPPGPADVGSPAVTGAAGAEASEEARRWP